ncbi:transcriptional regulator, LacI family [Caloramator quimbayensis]|uniref:Transcriptional regulator, LacI family n=1 Tax=Caloramator quimbayensis TaxID=1147123 RepID=A0A1T4Y698_9CLOT|nr:LacI family DNA-binding transcriptional regulator [Caloramator quimbayensis]SKA97266.1 transcriptional regulator, LacI family [Caloramator quimbayensis]
MTATIKDVAKKAGVGLGTVSRVLNNHPSVSEETKKKVLDAIKELEYNPNAIARSLKIKTTNSIGVMIPDISSGFYPEIVRGIEDVANKYKYNIMLLNTDLKREKEKQALIMLKEKKADGILFISNTIDYKLKKEFQSINIPIVLIATKDDNDEFYSVTIDNENAAFQAANYLIELGHKNIAMLAGKKEDPNAGVPRINGYKKALIENNINVDEGNIFYGDYKFKSGYENMLKILKLKKKPTAIFAASDTMAVGAASCAMQMGYRIPDDFSIIGFDGIELSEYFYPPLTTIKQPRYEMGAKGMEKLLKIIRGDTVEKSTELEFQLIKRSSCKFRGD